MSSSVCAPFVDKYVVQLSGEDGTQIQDDSQINVLSNDNQYRQYLTVTLYEDTTYRLSIQYDCNGQTRKKPRQNSCSISQNINVWIDFNDNEYDDGESRVIKRIQRNRNGPSNTYDFDLYIPALDNRNIRSGLHRMRLTVSPTEKYQRECGNVGYTESREYKVNILPKSRYIRKYSFFK